MQYEVTTANATYSIHSKSSLRKGVYSIVAKRATSCMSCAVHKEAEFYVDMWDLKDVDVLCAVNETNVIFIVNYLISTDVFSVHHLELSLSASM